MPPPHDPQAFAAVLRRYRVAAGLSQETLAERAGISLRGLSDLERGLSRAPRMDTLGRLIDALGLADADRAILRRASHRSMDTRQRDPTNAAADPVARPPGLPGYLTRLLGREREAIEASRLLRRDDVRVLTLVGPGGVGKTRLAVHVAGGLHDVCPDGVVLVPLAPLSDPGLVMATIAQSLGVGESAGSTPLDSIVLALRARRLLLVLDNCEHLLDAVPSLAELLRRCPSVRVLATSRTRLRVSGEQLFPVQPLAVPGALTEPEAALAWPSVALFVERAQAVHHAFALTSENVEAVVTLCRQLDGLPLALELAAARVAILPPAALGLRLGQRLAVLTGGARDAPVRHQTLRNTIAWSYDLLSVDEQRLFRYLGVFAGGWTLAAAEAVCARGSGEQAPEPVILDGITALVEQSLAQTSGDMSSEPRFSLPETVRQYAIEQLESSGEAGAVRRRHAEMCLRLAEEAEPHLIQNSRLVWLQRLDLELDNFRVALAWSVAADGDLELGWRLGGSLALFWYLRAYLQEGRIWLERLLVPLAHRAKGVAPHTALAGGQPTTTSRLHATTDAVRLLAATLDLLRTRPNGLQIGERELAILTALPASLGATEGYASSRLSEVQARAVELARSLGVETAPPLLRSLATASLSQGDFAAARQLGQQLHARGEREDDDVLVVESQYVLGIAAFWQGEFEAAGRSFKTAVQRYRPEHRAAHLLWYGLDPKVTCLGRLGNTLWFLGRAESAIRARDEALALADEIGHPYSRASALVFGSLLAIELHERERLRELVAKLDAGRAEDEARQTQISTDALTGCVALLDGQQQAGMARIQQALGDSGEADHAPGLRALIVRVLLEACAVAGDARAGLAATERMFSLSRAAQVWQAEAHRLRAEFLALLGAPAPDVELELGRALQLAHDQGALALELRAAASLVRQRRDRGDDRQSQARALLESLFEALPEGRDTSDAREAATLLSLS